MFPPLVECLLPNQHLSLLILNKNYTNLGLCCLFLWLCMLLSIVKPIYWLENSVSHILLVMGTMFEKELLLCLCGYCWPPLISGKGNTFNLFFLGPFNILF